MQVPSALRRVSVLTLAVTLLAASGCAYSWTPTTVAPPRQFEPKEQVEIWVAGEGERYHQVRVDRDTIRAVRYLADGSCRTQECARTFALAEVDSVRIRKRDTGGSVGMAAGFFALLAVLYSTTCNTWC